MHTHLRKIVSFQPEMLPRWKRGAIKTQEKIGTSPECTHLDICMEPCTKAHQPLRMQVKFFWLLPPHD